MKIALIRREYITHLDGVNRFIAYLAEGFIKLGYEATIFSWCYQGVEREKLGEWFKEMHGLDSPIPIHTLKQEPCRGDPWFKMAFDWLTKGSKLLSEEGFDVAIVNGIIPLMFKPKIAVSHGFTRKVGWFYEILVRELYRRYDRIICVSSKLRDETKTRRNIDCTVIPLPLKLELFKPLEPGEREDIIIHIGTRPVKNPQISIEAVKILREKGYNVKLVVIGPPATLPRVEGVEYKYAISEKEKLELLCKAKALILPSSYESFSYASLEATACGTPAVVSNATPEEVVIDGFNGIRVNSFNPVDYANALEKLLGNHELWLNLSRNALDFARKYNYIEIARKYIDLIKEIL